MSVGCVGGHTLVELLLGSALGLLLAASLVAQLALQQRARRAQDALAALHEHELLAFELLGDALRDASSLRAHGDVLLLCQAHACGGAAGLARWRVERGALQCTAWRDGVPAQTRALLGADPVALRAMRLRFGVERPDASRIEQRADTVAAWSQVRSVEVTLRFEHARLGGSELTRIYARRGGAADDLPCAPARAAPARQGGFALLLCLVLQLLALGGALALLHGALLQQRLAAAGVFERPAAACADSRLHCRPCQIPTTSSC
jgi:hypothetical protein